MRHTVFRKIFWVSVARISQLGYTFHNMKKPFLLFCLAIILSSCATTRSYEDRLLGWKGKPAQSLISKWGPPTNTINLADGGKVLRYKVREKGNKQFEKQLASVGEKASPFYDCRTDLLVDSTDIIVGWKFDGPNCRAH